VLAVNEDHVVEVIDRFETHDQRRKSVLFENTGGRQSGLEAMCAAVPENLTQASKRPAVRLGVVWQAVEKALHERRSAQPADQALLRRREDGERWCRMVHHASSCSAAHRRSAGTVGLKRGR
jgi:hypothetical protein